jgi:hypothetical protein
LCRATRRKVSGNDVPSAVGDELADARAAKSLRLGALASGLGVREGREQLEPATTAIGVKPPWGSGHAAEAAERNSFRQGQVRCATFSTRMVVSKGQQSWTITTWANRWW